MNWEAFAWRIGSVGPTRGSERASTRVALAALEELVGREAIIAAFNAVFDFTPGAVLAQYVLIQLSSTLAFEMAYERYLHGDPVYRGFAVLFMGKLRNERALDVLPLLLADQEVIEDALFMGNNSFMPL